MLVANWSEHWNENVYWNKESMRLEYIYVNNFTKLFLKLLMEDTVHCTLC